MVIHESAEDYLESILALEEQLGRGQVHSIDIVNRLGYSKPSVSIAMKKLRENGYISMARDGSITLNDSGLAIAGEIYHRHKTLTRLFELIGVSPETAEEDACKVEHDLSQETFDRIEEFLGRCPRITEEQVQEQCLGSDAEDARLPAIARERMENDNSDSHITMDEMMSRLGMTQEDLKGWEEVEIDETT